MNSNKILIIESDSRAAVHLEQLFTGLPLELHFAKSRAESQEVSLRCRFSLCLIAHGLIDGNGLPLLREVFGGEPATVGVLISRHPDLWVIQQAFDAGYSAVLSQPPDSAQLAAVLHRVFGSAVSSWRFMENSPCPASQPAASMTLSEIACLTMTDIRQRLSNSELIQIIRSVEYPFAGKERLEYFDRDTLERVVCLIRRWSQQRLERLQSDEPRMPAGLTFAADAAPVWNSLAAAG
jgi:CheY-like chemotaxis protein